MHREGIEQLLASIIELRIKADSLSEQLRDGRMLLHDLMTMRREILGYRKDAIARMHESVNQRPKASALDAGASTRKLG